MIHLQWFKQAARNKSIKWFSADAPHQFTKHDEIDVAVTEHGVGITQRLLGAGECNSLLVTKPVRGTWKTGPQTGRMRQEMLHRDIAFAVNSEIRHVPADRSIQLHPSL